MIEKTKEITCARPAKNRCSPINIRKYSDFFFCRLSKGRIITLNV